MYNFQNWQQVLIAKSSKTFLTTTTKQIQAWCAGRTGYPIVDAAMRQMNEIGWMHNRCRMIVANFLTKDLLLIPSWEKSTLSEAD